MATAFGKLRAAIFILICVVMALDALINGRSLAFPAMIFLVTAVAFPLFSLVEEPWRRMRRGESFHESMDKQTKRLVLLWAVLLAAFVIGAVIVAAAEMAKQSSSALSSSPTSHDKKEIS